MRLAPLLLLALAWSAGATNYFVDFDGGSDSNNGNSTITPWKHAKGDVNATGVAASTTPSAGDTIYFKGGVVYRGGITIPAGGSIGNPITYDGSPVGWGTGQAIMDGSAVITTLWTACTNSTDAGGNTNFANIWWTTIPAGVSNCLPQMFVNGTNFCPWSQDPTPADPIFWETTSEFRNYDFGNATTTNLVDSLRLTNASPAFFNESFIAIWVQSTIDVLSITNYDPATHKITFGSATSHPPQSNPSDPSHGKYAIIGNLAYIDTPGEWCVRVSENRLYFWPTGNQNPNGLTVSIGQPSGINAFTAIGVGNLVIKGFTCRGYYQRQGTSGYNAMFVSTGDSSHSSHNVLVSSNEIYFMRSFNAAPVIYLQSGSNMVAQGNYIHDTTLSRGMILSWRGQKAIQNRVSRSNGTGIYFANVQDGLIISNTVTDLKGIHGNGITVYQLSTNVTVAYNNFRSDNLAITSQTSYALKFYNNVIDCGDVGDAAQTQIDYDYYGTVFVNNTICGIPASPVQPGFVRPTYGLFSSNCWDGITNIYENNTTWGVPQGKKNVLLFYNGNLDPGNKARDVYWTDNIYTNQSSVFVDPANHDWRLKSGSPAIGAGVNHSSLYTNDIIGVARGSVFDIGAYEFSNDTNLFSPAITSQPQSITRAAGQSATFTVVATGSSPLSYQWKKGGVSIGGATSSSYTIASVVTGDAGSYTVTVSNSVGTVTSSAATLTIGSSSTFWTITTSASPIGGGTVGGGGTVANLFPVTVTGSPNTGYAFQNWTEGGFQVSASSSYTFTATENRTLVANFAALIGTNLSGGTVTFGRTISQGHTVRR